jgi:primosomal protein N' (replication factor Y)
MALLVLAGRLVGGRHDGGRILVQTRIPDHRVLAAAVRADPGRFAVGEAELRRSLGFPPFGALAEIGGPGAAAAVDPLRSRNDITVMGPTSDGRFLVRAATPELLADALGDLRSTKDRFRVAVDPPRI